MPSTTQSTQFDTLTPIQIQVLQSLVEGLSVTAAWPQKPVSTAPPRTPTQGHLWNRTLPDFASAYLTLRQQRPGRFVDELAINTFRHICSDESASASVRLKVAMEIVKTRRSSTPHDFSSRTENLTCSEIHSSRAQCCLHCGNPVLQTRAAAKIKYRETNPAISFKTNKTATRSEAGDLGQRKRDVSTLDVRLRPRREPNLAGGAEDDVLLAGDLVNGSDTLKG